IQTASQALSITIAPALSITTPSLAAGMVSQPYSQPLAATGGTTPYTWSVSSGTLPPGLSLLGSTITGTPTNPGTTTFTLHATDSTPPTPPPPPNPTARAPASPPPPAASSSPSSPVTAPPPPLKPKSNHSPSPSPRHSP